MAGKKGRSGRRSWKEELETKSLAQQSIQLLKWALKSNEVSLEKKIDIALHIASKVIPQRIQAEASLFESRVVVVAFSNQQDNQLQLQNRINEQILDAQDLEAITVKKDEKAES